MTLHVAKETIGRECENDNEICECKTDSDLVSICVKTSVDYVENVKKIMIRRCLLIMNDRWFECIKTEYT